MLGGCGYSEIKEGVIWEIGKKYFVKGKVNIKKKDDGGDGVGDWLGRVVLEEEVKVGVIREVLGDEKRE